MCAPPSPPFPPPPPPLPPPPCLQHHARDLCDLLASPGHAVGEEKPLLLLCEEGGTAQRDVEAGGGEGGQASEAGEGPERLQGAGQHAARKHAALHGGCARAVRVLPCAREREKEKEKEREESDVCCSDGSRGGGLLFLITRI